MGNTNNYTNPYIINSLLQYKKMKEQPTFAQMLGILSVIVIPLIVWGVSVETRFASNIQRIEQNEKMNYKTSQKLDLINDNTTEILVQLQNKENRK